MLITVATPTYNRATLLPRLYLSLCKQTCTDFEWLVVDDGSTDGTEETVKNFISEGNIAIRYLRKPNGGKHTAVNLAAKEARGELFFIADSDDWLPATAIADVVEAFTVVGSGLPRPAIDASPNDIRGKWGVSGDLKEVFRTDVIRQFPFPEIPGERFCPEVLVWNRIGARYKLRYFNKPVYTAEYQPDGLTNGITLARMKSPVASMLTYSEWFLIAGSVKAKLRMAVNFWRFALCAAPGERISIAGWGKLLFPVGVLFHIKDKIVFR